MISLKQKKLVIIVPLRRASQRIPEKIYASIGGSSLSQKTVERVLEFSRNNTNIVVAAAVDDIKTLAHLKELYPKLDVFMTDPKLQSGTDRVYSAYLGMIDKKLISEDTTSGIINLQGDMPFFSLEILQKAKSFFESQSHFEGVWTAGHAFERVEDLQEVQFVKALRSASGRAVYFSRFPIPFSRAELNLAKAPLCHIGVYGYTPLSLSKFCKAPTSTWEQSESLEQLRALYNDLPFVIDEVPVPPSGTSYRGIDTPADLEWANSFAPNVV